MSSDLGFGHDATKTVPTRSLEDFIPEILMIIFENLPENAEEHYSRRCRELRLVSRTFNSIATPFGYHHIDLNNNLFRIPTQLEEERAIENIHLHTRHMSISLTLNWDQAAILVSKCQALKSISWFLTDQLKDLPMPPTFCKAISQKEPRVSLNVLDYLVPLRAELEKEIRSSFPQNNLVFMSFVSALGPHTESLYKLLVGATNLHSLRALAPRGSFDPALGRLPAIKYLKYQWRIYANNTPNIWDFSRLEDLDMDDLDSFLPSVRPEDFPRLRKFKGSRCEYRVRPATYIEDQEKTASLLNRFLKALPLLEEIDVTTMLSRFDVSCLVNKPALRYLGLGDINEMYQRTLLDNFVGRREHPDTIGFQRRVFLSDFSLPRSTAFERPTFPALSPLDLSAILRTCPTIEELDLGLDRSDGNDMPLLQVISSFPLLRAVKLRTQTIGDELDEGNIGRDIDGEFVQRTWKFLRAQKRHNPFAKLEVDISKLVYLQKGGGDPDALDWDSLLASGHSEQSFNLLGVSWEDGRVAAIPHM